MLFSLNKDDVTGKCIARSLPTNALADPHHRYSVIHHSNIHFPFPTPQCKAVMSGDNQIDPRLSAAYCFFLLRISSRLLSCAPFRLAMEAIMFSSFHPELATSKGPKQISQYMQVKGFGVYEDSRVDRIVLGRLARCEEHPSRSLSKLACCSGAPRISSPTVLERL
jgi:hypothetical protein